MSAQDPHHSQKDAEHALGQLRALLVKPEQDQLGKLQERLNDPEVHARDISKILPEALRLRAAQDDELSSALASTIEASIEVSVKNNPQGLVDAIAPVMGPAIRQAIFQAINSMTEAINQTMEHSLSVQGFKWRIEAFRTGRSFGEVVLLHTLVYRVEQIFLIHRETGLLLQHVSEASVDATDSDMVSGMLTAIQDFVHDSFGGQGDQLQTMQVGELTVWISQGPQAILAGVIRGNAPGNLRTIFEETLERIHLEGQNALDTFHGDSDSFEFCHAYLSDCLQHQYRKEDNEEEEQTEPAKKFPTFLVLVGCLGLVLGWWIFLSIQDHARKTHFLEALQNEPGIVVTTAEEQGGKFLVRGLKDPLSKDPTFLLQEAKLVPDQVQMIWEPYLSFHPQFTPSRISHILQPPETVRLVVSGDTVRALGKAPHAWVMRARYTIPTLLSVKKYDESELINTDLQHLSQLRQDIEKQHLVFLNNDVALAPAQEGVIAHLAKQILLIFDVAQRINRHVLIEIQGLPDDARINRANEVLSYRRAGYIRSALSLLGVPPNRLIAIGQTEHSELNNVLKNQMNRRAIFRIRGLELEDSEI